MPLIFTSINFIGLLQHVYITVVKKQKEKERANCPVALCEIGFRDSLGLKPRMWKTTLSVWHRFCTGNIIGFFFVLEVLLALLGGIGGRAISAAAQKRLLTAQRCRASQPGEAS